jgi:hypothetical protein
MNVDATVLLTIVLVTSVLGHIVTSFWNYKMFMMMLRSISPSLRHRPLPNQPQQMPAPRYATDKLDEELEALRS